MNIEKKLKIYQFTSFVVLLGLVASLYLFLKKEDGSGVNFANEDGEAITLSIDEIKELYQFSQDLHFNNNEILEQWKKKRGINPRTGRWISHDSARIKHNYFTSWNTRPINLRKEIRPSGFAFGIDNLRDLIDKMDSINTNHLNTAPDTMKIKGVRAYLTFSKISKKKNRHLDLMIIPVRGNGNNYQPIDKANSLLITEPKIVLNTSSPCPDNCSQ